MDSIDSLLYHFVPSVGAVGLLISFILYFINKDRSVAPRLLALYLCFLSFLAIHHGLLRTNFFLNYPTLWRSPVFFSLIISPLAFLYVQYVLNQEKVFKPTHYLYFFPAIVYGLNFVPFYFLPADQQKALTTTMLMNKKMIVGELEGILPYDWGIMLRIIYGISFSVAQFLLIRKNKMRIRKQGLESFKNEEVFKWLYYFTTWLLVSFSLLFVRLIFDSSFYINISQAIYISISLSILFTCFYLLFNPAILYGIREILIQEPLLAKEEFLNTAADLKHDGASTVVPVDEPDSDFRPLIINHFTLNKPFLKVGYNLNDLSNELDIPVYRLSANMNQVFGMNFKELVNDFRIDCITDSLKSSDSQHKYSLDGLAEFGGFKSRNSLINAVKKKTGENPTAYFSQFIPD